MDKLIDLKFLNSIYLHIDQTLSSTVFFSAVLRKVVEDPTLYKLYIDLVSC